MFNPVDPSKYILLAEDNSADVELVREALQDRAIAHELHVVEDGERAIDFIERIDRDATLQCPKLFLLDLHLPKRDGEEVLRRLRASERCGQTPVVILTSSDSPLDRETAARNAALHYFRKPSTLEQFMQLGDVVKDIITLGAAARTVEIAS
jgi:two-component system, chemotaxis family, response regulator Rcp1